MTRHRGKESLHEAHGSLGPSAALAAVLAAVGGRATVGPRSRWRTSVPAGPHGRRARGARRVEEPRPCPAQRGLDRSSGRRHRGCSARGRSDFGERRRHAHRVAPERTATSARCIPTCAARSSFADAVRGIEELGRAVGDRAELPCAAPALVTSVGLRPLEIVSL